MNIAKFILPVMRSCDVYTHIEEIKIPCKYLSCHLHWQCIKINLTFI